MQVAGGHGQDAAEKVAHQVGFVAGAEIEKDDAERHANRPHDADDRVGAFFCAAVDDAHAQARRGG